MKSKYISILIELVTYGPQYIVMVNQNFTLILLVGNNFSTIVPFSMQN